MNLDLVQFISSELMIVSVCCYILGIFIKNTNKIKDYYIPFLLLFFAIVFCLLINGFNANSVLQAIICVSLATLTNNLDKQSKKISNKED